MSDDPSTSIDVDAVRLRAGSPTSDEEAAVRAVLAAALRELSEQRGLVRDSAPTAWSRTQRSVRPALHPGPGVWRGFSG